ncbi:MAG: hypothetical protein Tp1125DCM00d2C21254131_17 [Prokaryotic dsDNA virus sp.]|nr:MAG: hypothetical protein Tp1125DCM00d2C21254131_17 [Prokaryotic dsDNA virus sp.]
MSFWKKSQPKYTPPMTLEDRLYEADACRWFGHDKDAFRHLHLLAVALTAQHERRYGEQRDKAKQEEQQTPTQKGGKPSRRTDTPRKSHRLARPLG